MTYEFDEEETYKPYHYPRNYQGKEGVIYGYTHNKDEVFDYHISFAPKFYTAMAKLRYEAETYARNRGEKTEEKQRQLHQQVEETLTEAITELLVKTWKPGADPERETDDDMEIQDENDQDENGFGPAAADQKFTFYEPAADVQETRSFTQKDDKRQDQPKPQESTENQPDVQVHTG